MKCVLSLVIALAIPGFAHALKPTNNCGRGQKIVTSYVCADAASGGTHSLGAFVICSKKADGQNIGYTSLLDDNVVAYGGGYQFGKVTLTATRLTISNGTETDVLDLRSGKAVLQNNKMKCRPSDKN